jgi:hypothetical protein
MAQIKKTSMSLDATIERIAREMLKQHGAQGMTDYLRGIVVLDYIISSGGRITWHDPLQSFPMWTTAAFGLTLDYDPKRGTAIVKMTNKVPETLR